MFYTFRQNNSGGSFHRNDSVDVVTVVEADSADEANDRAETLGIYFGARSGDCVACCGYRWDRATDDADYSGTVPTLWGREVSDDEPRTIIHRKA